MKINSMTTVNNTGAYTYDLVWDDFSAGFATGGPGAKWTPRPVGPFPQGDGVAETCSRGLNVVPTGTNPRTGEPAFAWTTGQEHDGGEGPADHAKWYAMTAHTATSGMPGFDVPKGHTLAFRTRMSGRVFGVGDHPFGAAVPDPQTDLRPAAAAFSVIDVETLTLFDIFITNRRLYAFYERLPAPGARYAAFSHAMPVADRVPNQWHDLEIRFDEAAGAVTWLVDGRIVRRVDRLGRRPEDRTHLLIDLGGSDEEVAPRQLAGALGLFAILDGKGPDGRGLVRLTDAPNCYYAPDLGAPHPQRFVDEESLPENRLWGQGARLDAEYFAVRCELSVSEL